MVFQRSLIEAKYLFRSFAIAAGELYLLSSTINSSGIPDDSYQVHYQSV